MIGNEVFLDILGKTEDEIKGLEVISLAKFSSFEGPQTAAYLFDNIEAKGTDFPDFTWVAPLG